MDGFGAVRDRARTENDAIRMKADGPSATSLLAAARIETGLKVQFISPEHPLLGGGDGALHRKTNAIYISNALSPEMAAFVEAHEFGHYWIETPADPAVVPKGADPGIPEEGTPLGLRRVEAYSPDELRERYANVFAREFLLPCAEARRRFLVLGQTAPDIARELTVPLGLVHQQLAVALLLPEAPASEKSFAAMAERPGLDDSQRRAAEHLGAPLLVEAGPGTGKTRTLIARIEFLIGRGVPPASILALTYSNKAAREIRERVALSLPAAASEIWAGTFHAFGLELLRKYGDLVGIAQPVKLLDQADILAMLEEYLPELGLDHYLRLHDPLSDLRFVMGSISRAKDEVKSPDEYAAAAKRMPTSTEEDKLAAGKAAEVARVYAFYDKVMREKGWVDFADLINRPVELLRGHPAVRDELRMQYQHLLVDEYQDVNRASALLVKELAGEGENLWVVGDARQSIYRFRGAAPTNTKNFKDDYPKGERTPLAINYRSRQQIVDTFGTFAGKMQVGSGTAFKLVAHGGPGSNAVDFNVASDRGSEIGGIAETIKRHQQSGVRLRDQVVLCRVHANLERVALGLEAAGVPVLYLGDLFERPEICDLLALLSFVAEPHRGGLLRVADLKPYRVPLADVRAILAYAADTNKTPLAALEDASTISGISESGRAGLGALAADLAGTDFRTGPGALLCNVLFNRGALLKSYLDGDTPYEQQRRLAIHQFLQFAIENNFVRERDPKRSLLQWVRRLEVFGEERALREAPAAVDGIDAVRLMTVHASKGLEFGVVHLPMLGAGMFPLRWQGQRCPAPSGLLPTSAKVDHEEEEECLFYVALSRARDHLSISRAESYSGTTKSKASKTLLAVAAHLPRPAEGIPTWTKPLRMISVSWVRPDLLVDHQEHDGRDVELYLGCARRYLYQIVLGLSGGRDDTAYVRFHRAVYRVLGWLSAQPALVDNSAMAGEFEAAWREIGPYDHPLEPLFRSSAQRMLEKARVRDREGIVFGTAFAADIGGKRIMLEIDELQKGSGPLVIRRTRTGRSPSKPDQRHLHAMMLHAARQQTGAGARFEVQYLTTDEKIPVELDGVMNARLNDVREALLNLGKGDFAATPRNNDDCPTCPHYFICPSVPF